MQSKFTSNMIFFFWFHKNQTLGTIKRKFYYTKHKICWVIDYEVGYKPKHV